VKTRGRGPPARPRREREGSADRRNLSRRPSGRPPRRRAGSGGTL